MTDFDKMKSFLSTVIYHEEENRDLRESGEPSYPFLTISREAGAGGNSLAEALLEKLKGKNEGAFQGWQRFNQELCKKIAEEPGVNVVLKPLLQYEYRSEIEDMASEMIMGTTPQDVINKKIFHLMRKLAIDGKCILIGRGGVCLTRDLPNGIHIRLVAPLESRIKRMSALLDLSYEKTKEIVREQDSSRAKFLKTYFNRDIADPLLYDAVWNTSTVPMDRIAAALLVMIESKWVPLRFKKQNQLE